MGKQSNSFTISQDDMAGRIYSLEQRVSMLESELAGARIIKQDKIAENPETAEAELPFSGSTLESSFGEFGLAWLGNLVLLFGIIFLEKFLQNKGMTLASSIIGYAATAGLFFVSRYLKETHKNLSAIFSLNGYILLFIVTMQLHFFTKDPLIGPLFPSLVLLLAVVCFQGYIAIRKQSEGLGLLAFIMAAVTAVVSDQTHFLLPALTIIAFTAVYFLNRFGWWRLLVFSIFMVYLITLFWLLGNPFMGHKMQVLKDHQSGYFYLYIIAAAYSSIALIRQKGLFPDYGIISSIIINGMGFSFLLTVFVMAFFKDNYILLFGSIALFCLVYSIFLQSRSTWKVTASLYALYSFVALSVTVYGIFGFPKAYLLLALQSLLVVSTALWFKSRVIVVMNTILFIILLISYLAAGFSDNSTNIAFALISLITARTLNWQKERLKIKTELLRNTNLVMGFFMVLYALYRLVPGNFVTLSWTLAAVLYFLLSFAMHNIKYRYLALATMGATAVYLFIIDLARVEIVFRVMALLFLAMISIALSLYYSKRRKKSSQILKEDTN